VWDEGGVDAQKTTALPLELLRDLRGKPEPLLVDLRWVRSAGLNRFRNPRFRDEVRQLAAYAHETRLNDIEVRFWDRVITWPINLVAVFGTISFLAISVSYANRNKESLPNIVNGLQAASRSLISAAAVTKGLAAGIVHFGLRVVQLVATHHYVVLAVLVLLLGACCIQFGLHRPIHAAILLLTNTLTSIRVRPSPAAIGVEPDDTSVLIRIFYGTDRAITGNDTPEQYFANDRSGDGRVTLGVCDVSIPLSDEHGIGDLERPRSWKLEFAEDPNKHVILQHVSQIDDAEFFGTLAQRVASSAAREAFVFVHGYNVTFADAARRTA
jgi:hypothetical protein